MKWTARLVIVAALCLMWPWYVILVDKVRSVVKLVCRKWESFCGDGWMSFMILSVLIGCFIVAIMFQIGWYVFKNNEKKSAEKGDNKRDDALGDIKGDLLQRDSFIKALSNSFQGASVNCTGAEYVALYAPWGDGKTTVINFLKEAKKDCMWAELNVWPDESYSHPACKLYCSLAKAFWENCHWILAWRFWVMAVRLSIQDVVSEFGFTLSIPLGFIAAIFSIFGTVDGMRKQNGKRMRRYLGKEIVMVVDDLDRLPPKEAMRILMMLRSFGDLPNVTYIIAAEQEHLLAAIAEELPEKHSDLEVPRHFLEKFMTRECRLPVANVDLLMEMFMNKLTEFAERQGASLDRMDRTILDIVMPYINNIRSLKRYFAALEFEWKMQVSKTEYGTAVPSVDFPDVVALTAIRVFEPVFYDKLWPYGYLEILKKSYKVSHANPKCVSEEWLNKHLLSKARNKPVVENFMETCLGLHRKYDIKASNQGDKTVGFYFAELEDGERCVNYSLASSAAAPNYFSSHVSSSLLPKNTLREFLKLLTSSSKLNDEDVRMFFIELDNKYRIPSLINALQGMRIDSIQGVNLRRSIRVLLLMASTHLKNAEQSYRKNNQAGWIMNDCFEKAILNILKPVICSKAATRDNLTDYLADCLCEFVDYPAMLIALVGEDVTNQSNKDFDKTIFSEDAFRKIVSVFVSIAPSWKGNDIIALPKDALERTWQEVVAFYDNQYGGDYQKAHNGDLQNFKWVRSRMMDFYFEFNRLNKKYVGLDPLDACLGANHVKDMLDNHQMELSSYEQAFYNDLTDAIERKKQGKPYKGIDLYMELVAKQNN